MSSIVKRNTDITVSWNQQIEYTLRARLVASILNLDPGPKADLAKNLLKISVTIDGTVQHDWEIAKATIGNDGIEAILLAQMLVDENEINFATNYILVILRYPYSNRRPSRYVVPCVARVDHPYETRNYRKSYQDNRWLNDWDEAFSSLVEEAIGLGQKI